MESKSLCEDCKNAIDNCFMGQGMQIVICKDCSLSAASDYFNIKRAKIEDEITVQLLRP